MINTDFVYAGKAVFVVRNDKGNAVTVRVRKGVEKINPRTGKPYDPAYFVSTRNNNAPWTYLGALPVPTATDRKLKFTAKTVINDETIQQKRIVDWALRVIAGETELPSGYDIHHSGRCGRCSKLLRDPISIERGLGPECIKHTVFN